MKLELEGRDNPEVATAASEAPKEIFVFVLACVDELATYMSEVHNWSVRQKPKPRSVVYCDDCAEERPSLRERAAEQLSEDDRLDILFECGTYEYVSHPDSDEVQAPYRGPQPKLIGPLECDCDA